MKSLTALLALVFSFQILAIDSGRPAPDFKLNSANGKDIQLSELKGKVVVLEWTNHKCPFVAKHYDSGNMQKLQEKYVAQNVVWLSIVSSAPEKQGYVNHEEAKKIYKESNSHATEVLLDPTGSVGKLYDAKTTPHMFVIDKEGILVYQGAIDSGPDTKQESIKKAKNYVAQALDEILSGKKVTISKVPSYGCSVKY